MRIQKIFTPLQSICRDIKTGSQSTAKKIYDNSNLLRKSCKLGKDSTKPVFEMKDIYMKNKKHGKVKAVKAIFKEKGVCAPILTGSGVLAGTFLTPIPGAGLVAGIGGYIIGHGIDKGAKIILDTVKKVIK